MFREVTQIRYRRLPNYGAAIAVERDADRLGIIIACLNARDVESAEAWLVIMTPGEDMPGDI